MLDWSQGSSVSQQPMFWVWRSIWVGYEGAWGKILPLEFTNLSHLGQGTPLLPKT